MNTEQPEALRLAELLDHCVPKESTCDEIAVELRRQHALLNTPELLSFRDGVVLEAAHQRERWGSDHDGGKTPEDWYWLIGHLAGRALAHHKEAERLFKQAADFYPHFDGADFGTIPNEFLRLSLAHHRKKAVHHCITTAAAMANWHAAVLGKTNMRPVVDPATITAAAGATA